MKIVVLSRNADSYSTSRIIKEGLIRNHEIIQVDHSKCDLIIEKKNPAIIYKGKILHNTDAVIPRIGASLTFYGTAVIRQFELMKVFTTVQSQALLHSRDKLCSFQLLSKAGLGLPKTVFTNYSKNVNDIIRGAGGAPVVIKLLEGTQGLGVVLAETENAAESVIQAFNGMKIRVIVQEYIKEVQGSDVRVFVVDGEVVGAIKRQAKNGEFRSNLHRGGTARVIQLTEDEEKAAIKAARTLGLGICGVDLLQSNHGPLILEVNSSPGLEGIEKATGTNIAEKIIQYVEKHGQPSA
ncbi:MAG: 30S ribosomal protein S6--L-glutamate ligase [Draconibacterium sp.]